MFSPKAHFFFGESTMKTLKTDLGISLIGPNGEDYGIFIPDDAVFDDINNSDLLPTPVAEDQDLTDIQPVGQHSCHGMMRIICLNKEGTFVGPVVMACDRCNYQVHLGDWSEIVNRGQFINHLDRLMLQKAAQAQQRQEQEERIGLPALFSEADRKTWLKIMASKNAP